MIKSQITIDANSWTAKIFSMIKTPVWPDKVSCLTEDEQTRLMPRAPLLGLCVLLVSLICSGCPKNEPSFTLDLQIVPDDGISSTTALTISKYSVRLSFLKPAPTAEPQVLSIRDVELICDRVIPPRQTITFQVPNIPDPAVILTVDVFSDEGEGEKTLIYSGRQKNVNLTKEEKSAKVLLFPAGRVVKTRAPAAIFRAFHTATLLPNGEVMLVGGMIADPPDNYQTTGQLQDNAFVSPNIELYDPATLTFVDTKVRLNSARAFHQAHLLPTLPDGTFRVLVYGGVKPVDDTQPAFQVRTKALIPFLFTPTDSAEAAEAVLISYRPDPNSTDLSKIVTTKTLDAFPKTMFPAMGEALSQSRIVFAGGGPAYASLGADYGFTGNDATAWVSLTDQNPVPEDQQRLNQIRAGHAMAQLGDRYLIWGGNMTGASEDIGEILPVGAAPTPAAITQPKTTAWHTLTPIGSSDRDLAGNIAPTAALLAGGFELAEEAANLRFATSTLRTPALLWVRQSELSFQPVTENSPAGGSVFEPVGYHDAIRLHDGSVLLSGGNCAAGLFCATPQLVICKLEDDPVCSPAPSTLTMGRFGHRMTRLLDNTVLITGGITGEGNMGQLLKDAEIFNPRLGHASEDFPFDREPAAESKPCQDVQAEE